MSKPDKLDYLYSFTITKSGIMHSIVLEGKTESVIETTQDGINYDSDKDLGETLASMTKNRCLVLEVLLCARQAQRMCFEMREAAEDEQSK